MKKLIYIVLLPITAIAQKTDFQKFNNQFSLGYQLIQGTLINGARQTLPFKASALNLEVERLFNNNIWLNANFNMVTNYSQPSVQDKHDVDNKFGQNPFMMSFNLKSGYSFTFLNNKLQLLPHVMFGRTTNWATSTIIAADNHNLTTEFFLTGGLGIRLSYNINDSIMLYADELYAYNWDNSGAIKDVQVATYGKSYAATNYTFTTTLGTRYNVTNNFQVGFNAFWNNFQMQSNIAGIVYTPTNTFGQMLTIGYSY